MAATGKTPILLYGSITATNTPVAGNLTNSSDGCEIAINVADKNLFFKDATNTVNTVPIRQSSVSSNGWLSSTDWSTFNGKQAALVSGTNIKTVSGTSLLGSGDLGTIGVSYGGTGQTSFSSGYIHFGSFSTDSSFVWDNTNKRLAIGGITPNTSVDTNGFYGKRIVTAGTIGTPASEYGLQYYNGTNALGGYKFYNIAQNTFRSWSSITCANDSGTIADYFTVHPYNGVYLVGNLYPTNDNSNSCGQSSNRWTVVYATTGTINTSDANSKQQIRTLEEKELAVAKRCKTLIRAFKFNDSVAVKGNNARIHFGVIAQDVKAAFELEGLDVTRYGLFCSDVIYKVDGSSVMPNDDGKYPENAIPEEQLGVRYEELFAFIISAL